MPRSIAPEIIRSALPVFTAFLMREGFDEEVAIEEYARIAPFPSSGEYMTASEYIVYARRTGSMFPMNRESRRMIYMSFENALNHVSFTS